MDANPGQGPVPRADAAPLADATVAFEQALPAGPAAAAAYQEFGAAGLAAGQYSRAVEAFENALRLTPESFSANYGLANAAHRLGDLPKAAQAYERAVALEPQRADAWLQLGMVRQRSGNHDAALAAYREVLTLQPASVEAENNQGLAFKTLGRPAVAVAAFRRALALRPDDLQVAMNLSAALEDNDCPAEAIAVLQPLAVSQPPQARLLAALGNAHLAANQTADAIAAYESAVGIEPANDEIRYNLALAQLVTGDFERGWRNYDARLSRPNFLQLHVSPQPRWHGNVPLAGRTLLVSGEQGIGDSIQFLRYLPLLQARGARVIVRVHSALKALVASQWPAVQVIGGDESLPAHDYHCPLPSLALEFGTRLDTIPATIPYLHAPAGPVEAWQRVFSHALGLKVGLVWAGNPRHSFDPQRSIPLERFSDLTSLDTVHFFALQATLRETDPGQLARMARVTDLSPQIPTLVHTAAIISALDLVITVDTAVAHLAGALGAKAWVLLRHAPDWRWLLARDDSPWYPTVRLFRQPVPGDWSAVLATVNSELVQWSRA